MTRKELARAGTQTHVASLEEAMEVARAAGAPGDVWYRGQVHPWPPSSSLSRLRFSEPSESFAQAEASLSHFLHWAGSQEDVRSDLDSDEKAVGAAQHYGVPTDFIDFTLSVEVAAFFATDVHSEPPGEVACIYLLKVEELQECLFRQPPKVAEALQVYPVLDRVANLWRLETQKGLFLNAPTRWWEWFEMDRILFPRPAPQTKLRRLIYPPERSRLEDRMDRYFQRERMRLAAEEREKQRATHTAVELKVAPPSSCAFVADQASLAPGWTGLDEAPWRRPTERHVDVAGGDVGINQALLDAPGGLAVHFEGSLILSLDADDLDRKQALGFRILDDFEPLEPEHCRLVETALRRIWDGMRSLPFSDLDLAQALTRCLTAATAGLGGSALRHSGRPEAWSFSRQTGEEWMELALVAPDGSYARGLTKMASLRQALRPDLAEILTARGRALADDPKKLFQVVQNPRLLFPFDSLVSLLALDLIPTQPLLLGHDQSPVFFSPLKVERVGLP